MWISVLCRRLSRNGGKVLAIFHGGAPATVRRVEIFKLNFQNSAVLILASKAVAPVGGMSAVIRTGARRSHELDREHLPDKKYNNTNWSAQADDLTKHWIAENDTAGKSSRVR